MVLGECSGQLKEMETCWTVVMQAHAGGDDTVTSARRDLLERYSGAIYRYLVGAVRDPDVAADLSQEFALRLLRGEFHRVHPERGRFRDYIRSVLINMVRKYYREQQRRPQALAEESWAVAPDAEFPSLEECLRVEVLARTWKALKQAHPRYYTVLKLRAHNPGLSSSAIAEQLTAVSGCCWKSAQVRKTIERARALFVELLFAEVSSSFQCTDQEDLWEALEGLDLLKYCRHSLVQCAIISGRQIHPRPTTN
jgi:RNA polymerase sigma-70 factor (ECF subfamily)